MDNLETARRPSELDHYVGRWVAIKRGKVVAHAGTSRELVAEVRKLGDEGDGAVAQFVAPPSQSWMVGVG